MASSDPELDDDDSDEVQLSADAMHWFKRNRTFLERGNRKLWDLEEWETFERWANNRILQLEADKKELQSKLNAALFKAAPTYKEVCPQWRKGMDAIEDLVCKGSGVTLAPVKHDDRISARLDLLASAMASKGLLDEQTNT